MNEFSKPFYESLIGWVETLKAYVRAALFAGIDQDNASREAESAIDPDFEGWLHNDPMVTGNPASRYGKSARGYLTRNGLGSLEIGAADD